jgi:hypothetical protein
MNERLVLGRLRRIRWGVRATLTFGVAASVAANVLHAQQNPISQAISAWPPLALLLTAELVSRVPVHRKSLAAKVYAESYVVPVVGLVRLQELTAPRLQALDSHLLASGRVKVDLGTKMYESWTRRRGESGGKEPTARQIAVDSGASIHSVRSAVPTLACKTSARRRAAGGLARA